MAKAPWRAAAAACTRRIAQQAAASVRVTAQDVWNGLVAVSGNALALLGLATLLVVALAVARPDLRHEVEVHTLGWLKDRLEARQLADGDLAGLLAEPEAVARATAAELQALNRQQADVARWLARRYKVAAEPVAALVREAWAVGARTRIDPTLILAVMAVESAFNPFAQSPMGAQGLMQVMTRVHDDKYEAFGGTLAAFDPITNLRVGVQVLHEAIRRSGSVEGGLRQYVGATLLDTDGGYAQRVLTEQEHLRRVAAGEVVPVNAPRTLPLAREGEDLLEAVAAERVPPPAAGTAAPARGTNPVTPAQGKATPATQRVALLR